MTRITTRLVVSIDPTLDEKVRAKAGQNRWTLTAAVTIALEQFVNNSDNNNLLQHATLTREQHRKRRPPAATHAILESPQHNYTPAPPLPTYDIQPAAENVPSCRWMSADEVQKVVKGAWFLWLVEPGDPPADNSNVVITTDSEGVNWYVDVSERRRWEYHT